MKFFLVLTLLWLTTNLSQAQNFNEVLKAVAADRGSGDQFGYAVSISGNYAVVGAYQEDQDTSGNNTLTDAGSAYIFERNAGAWMLIQKVTAPVRGVEDEFGKTVCISGDYLIVGAPFEDEDAAELTTKSNAGAAYIFERNGSTWAFVKKIVANDREADDRFGFTVSISGDYALVGAPFEDENTNDADSLTKAGSAYIFQRNGGTWNQIQKIVASDRESNDEFASALAISGGRLIIGASREDEDVIGGSSMGSAGSAYIFERNGSVWNQTQKIVASDRHSSDLFGFAVAIDGDYAVVGAYQNDYDENIMSFKLNAGAAYVFEHNGTNWGQTQKIVASDRNASDQFGQAVDISADKILIGAYGQDEDATGGNTVNSAGGAYVFEYNGTNWLESSLLSASDRAIADNFSRYGVAIDNGYVIVGAYTEDEDAAGANTLASAGAAYIFEYAAPRHWYVDVNAVGTNDGLSWANAFSDLQAALDTVQAGDTIAIAEGTYYPNKTSAGLPTTGRSATFFIDKDIVIQGGYPTAGIGPINPIQNETILSGDIGAIGNSNDNAYHILSLEGLSSTAILNGLVIQEGNANGTPYVDDWGAGIMNTGSGTGNISNPMIQNCIFRWNHANYMGGAFLNNANAGGETSPRLAGCLFYENTADIGGGAVANATLNNGINTTLISNCTFADNTGLGASIYNRNGNANVLVQNSILWDNQAVRNHTSTNECTVSYSLVAANSLGASDGGNNILTLQNNVFADPANDDYSLSSSSLAIDNGSNALVIYNTDLQGDMRVLNGVVDLGAIETNLSNRLYVDFAATGNNTGDSWGNAYTDLQTALQQAGTGTEIWVAAGTYRPTTGNDRVVSFEIARGAKVYGGFAGTETSLTQRNWAANPTILSGDIGVGGNNSDNSYHVVVLTNASSTTLLDGLIIQEGYANGAAYIDDWGAGVLNIGSGAGNSSNPTIMNCVFRWNHANYLGGGILNNGGGRGVTSPTITGCLFYENTANTGGGAIGNITFKGGSNQMVITNSTFADNTGLGASVYNRNGNANVTVQNSILWDNSPIYNFGNETTVQYSSVKGASLASGTTDGGNNQLATDPLFVDPTNDDYSLQAISPAIANGNNAYLPVGYTMDLANNSRQIGTTVELGCYEDIASAARPELAKTETAANTSTEEQSLSINEEIAESSLLNSKTVASVNVYPNPVQAIVHINLKDVNQFATVRLLNTTGQVLHQEKLQADEQTVLQLNIGHLAKGIYLLNVQLEDGVQLNERVIKY